MNIRAAILALGVTVYKPHPRMALDLLCDTSSVLRRVERIAARQGVGRVAAETVRVGRWPMGAIAWKDGGAGGRTQDGGWQQRVETGQRVPTWAVRVVPEEHFAQKSLQAWLDSAETQRPEIMEPGREYGDQTAVVLQGRVLDAGIVSQLMFLGIQEIAVWARPQIVLVVAGEDPETHPAKSGDSLLGGVAAASWIGALLAEWGCPGVRLAFAPSLEGLEEALGESEVGVLISDGSPGRYASLRPLWSGQLAGCVPLFWKWNLLPCKHTGLVEYQGRPLLVLPDLAGKSMLSSLVLIPELASAAWCMPQGETQTVPAWSEVVVEEGACRIVPVSQDESADSGWASVRLDRVFSGRDVSAAGGWFLAERSIQPGDPVEIVRCRGREPWAP